MLGRCVTEPEPQIPLNKGIEKPPGLLHLEPLSTTGRKPFGMPPYFPNDLKIIFT